MAHRLCCSATASAKWKLLAKGMPLHLFMWCCADADRLGLLNVGLQKRTPLDVTSLKRSNPKLVCSTRAIMVMLKSAFLKMEWNLTFINTYLCGCGSHSHHITFKTPNPFDFIFMKFAFLSFWSPATHSSLIFPTAYNSTCAQ